MSNRPALRGGRRTRPEGGPVAPRGGPRVGDALFAELMMALPTGAVLVDPASAALLAFNDAACAIVGCSRAEMAAMRLHDLDADQSLEQLLARFDDVLRTGVPAAFRTRLRSAAGRLRLVEVTARAIDAGAGPAVYLLWNDLAERAEAEAREQVALEASGLGAWEWDPATDRVAFDARARHVFGLTGGGPFDGAALRERVVPEDRDAVLRRLRACIDPVAGGEYAIEYRILVPGVEAPRWIVSHGRAIFDTDARGARRCLKVVGAVQDATEALTARDAARAAAEHRQRVLDSLLCFVGVLDLDGRLVEVNRGALLATGITERQALGLPFWETPWWSHDAAVAERIREACRQCAQGRVQRFDTTYRTAGGVSDVDFVMMPLRDAQGRITHLVPNGIDIGERKRAERELAAQEETLSLAAEATQLGIWDWDVESGRLEWSPRMREIFGLAPGAPLDHAVFVSHVHPDDRATLAAARVAALAPDSDGRYVVEYRARRSDGEQRRLLAHAQARFAERDGARRAVRMVGTVLDVTDSRRMLDELSQLNTLTRAIGEATPTFLYLKDREGRVVYCNAAVLEALGKAPEEVIGRTNREFLGEGPATDAIEANDREVIDSGRTIFQEERVDRIGRVYLSTKTPWRDATGAVVGLAGVSFDVTEQRRAEAVLRERDARLAIAVEAAGLDVWSMLLPERVFVVPAGAAALHGIAPSERLDWETVFGQVDPAERARVEAAFERCVAGGGDYDQTYRTRDRAGRPRWVRAVARLVPARGPDEADQVVGVSIDLTEPHLTQARLADGEARLRLAIDATASGTYDWDLVGGELRWDARTRELFGVDPDAPASLDLFYSRLHPDDLARMREELERALADPAFEGAWHAQYRVRHGEGWRWITSPGRIHFEGEGAARRPVRFVGLVTDVTARLEAEQRLAASERALRESEERLRLAMRTSSLGWWDLDPRSQRVVWSENARRMFDLPDAGEVTLAQPVERMHPEDRPRVLAAIDAVLSGATGGHYREQYRVVWRDGSVRWIDAVGQASLEAGEDGHPRATRFVGVLWDVTEQRQLVDSLREADRRKDEFLAMLAHELRNPLAPVINAVKVLERTETLSPLGRRALEMAQRQVSQMKRLVDDLLEVSRITRGKIELKPEPMLLNAAVSNAAEAVMAACDAKRQTLEVAMPARLLRLTADPVRIAQVLENLLGNAIKYTPEGGTIRVEAGDAGDALEVRVVDDGIGIPADKLESVFELFVQAEPGVGEHQGGLGIGLAMVKRLVEMHGGSVRAESAGAGAGATFVVRLPKG